MRIRKNGFTLVEIMIVVVIIGLLAMLAVPAFKHVRETAQRTSITNNLRLIANAADEYFTQNGDASTVDVSSLIGATDGYIKTLTTVAGEDYLTTFSSIASGFTQLSITVPRFPEGNNVVYYNQ